MISIPIRVYHQKLCPTPRIYYITVIPEKRFAELSNKAKTYKTITRIINFTARTISPSDITMADIAKFNVGPNELTMEMQAGSSYCSEPIPSGETGKIDNNDVSYYYYEVHSYVSTTQWIIKYPKFDGKDLQSIGQILTRLIQNSHTHDQISQPEAVQSTRTGQKDSSGCCNSAVVW